MRVSNGIHHFKGNKLSLYSSFISATLTESILILWAYYSDFHLTSNQGELRLSLPRSDQSSHSPGLLWRGCTLQLITTERTRGNMNLTFGPHPSAITTVDPQNRGSRLPTIPLSQWELLMKWGWHVWRISGNSGLIVCWESHTTIDAQLNGFQAGKNRSPSKYHTIDGYYQHSAQ